MKPSLLGHEIHHDTCFGCGKNNPYGLQADFSFDDKSGEVRFTYKFPRHYNGAPGFSHGGVISTLMDETMGALCFHLGYIVMTDTMSYKFLKATPVENELLARAWPIQKEKRKIHLQCSLTSLDESITYVKGEGVFHILPPRFFVRKLDGGQHFDAYELLELNKKERAHFFDRIRDYSPNQENPK
ncbi:PaaI family thioesterase [Leptospira sp. GIMC2001]|uniref:PaaI family thioesterase n=1 Tax=Leptospira sp. GIMC2001 TaxID=1513297 RepID=UPI00234B72C2|nr:PaaI family thioesterase [Leptospira sp. GIMC2001]WCL47622.1 PaaI family thioesterase [Leptospira sp. GIMC2001]